MAQKLGLEIWGAPTPPTIKTKIEKERVIKIRNGEYDLLRSFTESSLKKKYPWRVAFEYLEQYFVWRKEGKWILEAYKRPEVVRVEALPVKGIYRIIDTASPIAVLKSPKGEILFVLLPRGEVAILHTTPKVHLAFTAEAPVAFAPITPVPFARLIPVYKVLDTLNHYVSF
jgi:hypothetical protein